jgi:ribosomal protein L37E
MKTITCARCGQETPFAYRKKFCTACNAKINREQAAVRQQIVKPKKPKKPKPEKPLSIAEVNKRARRLGMTYGQYEAYRRSQNG